MKVVIDHREPEAFRALFAPEDQVAVKTLRCGDFRINDQWVFERKTVVDFSVSLIDGRLFSQALELVRYEWHPVLIVEGRASDAKRLKTRRESIQGAVISLSVFWGIPVLRSMGPQETVRLMRYTVDQHQRAIEGGVPRFGYRPKGRKARQLYVLQGLPGIGKERAKALLEHFGSIEAIILANESALRNVAGIGASTARAIRALVAD